MKAIILLTAALLVPQLASAKLLTANCESDSGSSVSLVSEIKNANSPQVIQEFTVDGESLENLKDVSDLPIYKDGVVSLEIQFGRSLYSSVSFSLSKCQDSFESSGRATLKKYVGGFAGSSEEQLSCSCSLE